MKQYLLSPLLFCLIGLFVFTSCEPWNLERKDQMEELCQLLNCNNGTCNTQTGMCECLDGWSGDLCDIMETDSTNNNLDCGSNGTQIGDLCECDDGYTGARCDSVTTFIKAFGDVNIDELGYSMVETQDGGIAILGERDGNAHFLKINKSGEIVFSKPFLSNIGFGFLSSIDRNAGNGPGFVDPFGRMKIMELSDGSLVAMGYSTINDEGDVVIIFADMEGDFNNSDTRTITISGKQIPLDMIQLINGNFLIVGSSTETGSDNQFSLMLDNNGNYINHKSYQNAGRLWSVDNFDETRLAISGEYSPFGSPQGFFGLIEKSSLDLVFYNTTAYPENISQRPFSMAKGDNSNFYLFGYSFTPGSDLQYQIDKYNIDSGFDANGETFGDPLDQIGSALINDSNGKMIGAGFSGVLQDYSIELILNVVNSPTIKRFGFNKPAYNNSWDLIECEDGGYYILGTTASINPGGSDNTFQDTNFLLIKVDENGECYGSNCF